MWWFVEQDYLTNSAFNHFQSFNLKASSKFKNMISTLLFTISIPNLMKATSEDVQGLNNTFDFLHPNKAFDPKFYRLKNFAASATIRSKSAYFLSIYKNSNLWYRVISSTDPPLFGAKTMKGQRVNRHIWSIGQFIWNFAESETIRAISACLLSIYAMMKGIWLWRWWWSEWKN